jgi:hypothetical protein
MDFNFDADRKILKRSEFHKLWTSLAPSQFVETPLRRINVRKIPVYIVSSGQQREKPHVDVFFETGLSFFAKPRFENYRHRFVLLPKRLTVSQGDWKISADDLFDWAWWSMALKHIVLFSTFQSGASVPFNLHAQSIPLMGDDRVLRSSLPALNYLPVIRFGEMPRSERIEIHKSHESMIPSVRIGFDGSQRGLQQAVIKLNELALTYCSMKSFNVVVVPRPKNGCHFYFIPRTKRGGATFGSNRWQIGSFDVNGLLQPLTSAEAALIDSSTIEQIFNCHCADSHEYDELISLLHTF